MIITDPAALAAAIKGCVVAWPYDILGRARLNDGNGAAGAYER